MIHTFKGQKLYRSEDDIHTVNGFIANCDGSCDGIAFGLEQDEANAEFIVKACNAYDDLLKAAKLMAMWLDDPCSVDCNECGLLDLIEKAIAKTEADSN